MVILFCPDYEMMADENLSKWSSRFCQKCLPVDYPHKGPIMQSVSDLFAVGLDKLLSKQSNGRWNGTCEHSFEVTVLGVLIKFRKSLCRHDMDTPSILRVLCDGKPLIPGGFPSKSACNVGLCVSFAVSLNNLSKKQSSGRWLETP